ncbi:MAG TPA: hypothetical protein VND68_13995, partial [Chloroflexia bacterium]|nr:hypothetical protein [Chloroflexia bacterium]
YRLAKGPVEQYRLELGLYRLGRAGEPRWTATPLVEQFRSYVADPEAAIGTLATTPDSAQEPENQYLYGSYDHIGKGQVQGERSD